MLGHVYVLMAFSSPAFAQIDQQLSQDLQNQGSPCYARSTTNPDEDDLTKPMRCMPPFKNVVANSPVRVDPTEMTCGVQGKAEYCIQTGGYQRECAVCDASDPALSHNPEYLTDVEEEDDDATHWQSVTMDDEIQQLSEKGVNLTMSLGKSFDITYVRLKFSSPRPETFAIYKKNRRDPWKPDPYPEEDWEPWQYYSAYCEDAFRVPDLTSIIQPRAGPSGRAQRVGEARALCTSELSDISPLTGGNVAFSTLDGRPGAYNFDHNNELQDWVSATDIRISLMRLNTFGDEVFGDQKVLRSYYYGITHIVVGGRCKCNGHSNVCIMSSEHDTDNDGNPIPPHPKCLCQHGTTGDDCSSCLDDHWDRNWKRATSEEPNECLPCDCNGWSSKCRFNEELYNHALKRGGGECLDCEGNRGGAHCEICKPNSFPSPEKDAQGRQECIMCDCDPDGSTNLQCRDDGKCECKPGVAGEKCDQCAANYWNFPGSSDPGCESCECMVEGSLGNRPQCNPEDGQCVCKQNVEGRKCDRCRSGHFKIDMDNDFGCTPCFCFGHTSNCDAAPNYFQSMITSDFNRGPDDWKTVEEGVPEIAAQPAAFEKAITLQSVQETGYFIAPEKFLGDQRSSHNQHLTFSLRLGGDGGGARASLEDIIIESGGATPTRISLRIDDQNNPLPTIDKQKYSFKLHENPEFGWTPTFNSKTFIGLLSNITAIKIRGNYVPNGQGFLDEVQLETAVMDGSGKPANWVEQCECPDGFEGQFCERCIIGYYHENNGGPFARCIPCQCNGHSSYCDPESGVCKCEHNTGGDKCDICAPGYFGNALSGDDSSCQPCPCPQVQDATGNLRPGMCYEIPGNPESPICTECPEGRTGSRCEMCEDGYFGDPNGLNGRPRPCQKCDCNGNVDPSAIGNCDRTTGECLRCIDDTAGFHCETCKSGFYGDALVPRSLKEKKCKVCQCNPLGTHHTDENNDGVDELPICNAYSGKCECKANVVGQNCDTCRDGYWDISSGEGCKDCNCNTEGSYNATCDIFTGQCFCRPGVVGAQCDQCQENHYGFSSEGCTFCACDITGSTSHQCDLETGQCPCRDKVEGRQCDRCEENTKTRSKDGFEGVEKVCEPCDDCYNLVQNATDDIRNSLTSLTDLLIAIAENPDPIGTDFKVDLRRLQVRVKQMLADAKLESGVGNGGGVLEKFEKLQKDLEDVQEVIFKANSQLDEAQRESDQAGQNVYIAGEQMARAKKALKQSRSQLDEEGKDALRRAEEMARKMGAGNAKITEVAQQARKLAAEQSENASEVESIALQAKEESQKAYDKAMNAMNEQTDNQNHITQLKTRLKKMDEDLTQVQSDSVAILSSASDSYDEAMQNRLVALNLKVPEFVDSGPGSMREKAEKIAKDAERIRDDAERVMMENEETVVEVMNKKSQLDDLLRQSEAQQQQMDEKIAQMDAYRAEARMAVDLGNSVLSKAQETLQILQDFDSTVEENRADFEAIMQETNAIEVTLTEANSKTAQAESQISQTGGDTVTAHDIATESKAEAEKASAEAKRIVDESKEMRQLAEQLKASAEDMSAKLETTKSLVEEKEAAAGTNSLLANEALREANKAQSSSEDASKKVEQAKKELDDIMVLLLNIEDPDLNLLDDLTARLDEAERKYLEADLEERLKELEEAKQRQIVRKTELRKEYELVEAEMEIISGIIDQLPNTCPSVDPDHASGIMENGR